MDDRFFLKEQCKRDYEQIEKRNNVVRKEVRMILEKEDMPVFFLYVLPEIESWFLADWENTFGIEYRQKLGKINSYFSITFKNFVSRYVLTETYDIKDVENYGCFNGEYRKLSDKLILAFQEYSCVEDKTKNNQEYNCFINELIQANQIMYSKKEEGKNMLSRLDPERVAENCGHYFAKIYIDLKEFGCKNVGCN